MDYSVLFSFPVLVTAAVALGLAAVIGYAIGKAKESKLGAQALKAAHEIKEQSLNDLRHEHEKAVAAMLEEYNRETNKTRKSHLKQIEELNQLHQTALDRLKGEHLDELERLSKEHSDLIDKLNAANIANINDLKKEHETQISQIRERATAMVDEYETRRKTEVKEIKAETAAMISELKQEHAILVESIKREHQERIDTLRADHLQNIKQLEADKEHRIEELTRRHESEINRLNLELKELEKARQQALDEAQELQASINQLQADIKEARLNNMFSVSKSGEKLIRVVRSIQELASELDETSRTVTDGEYSFFEQIKDQRDRDTVLGLTGGTMIDAEEVKAENEQKKDGDSNAGESTAKN